MTRGTTVVPVDGLRTRLRSFYERRIDLPVGADDLVLDVGSGDKPSWRADVLLDRYPDEEYAGQRSGTGRTPTPRPLFDADAADMPFRDHAFDYAVCSHVLEHVPDPAGVVRELTRVAKAGYIEVPEASASKIVDFPSHLWWCRLDATTTPPTLVFEAKQAASFDSEIDDYLRRTGLAGPVKRLIDSQHHHNIVQLHWTGSQPVRVEGTLDPDFVERTVHADAGHHAAETIASRVLTRALTARRPRRRGPVLMEDILKPEFRVAPGTVLENRRYRVSDLPRS